MGDDEDSVDYGDGESPSSSPIDASDHGMSQTTSVPSGEVPEAAAVLLAYAADPAHALAHGSELSSRSEHQ